MLEGVLPLYNWVVVRSPGGWKNSWDIHSRKTNLTTIFFHRKIFQVGGVGWELSCDTGVHLHAMIQKK